MIDICEVQKERGSNRFGTCKQCGINTQQDKGMKRIRFMNVSVCLCDKCYSNFYPHCRADVRKVE